MPQLYLLIILASVIEPSFWVLLVFLLLFSWMGLTGVVRAEFLRGRNFDYVRAAKALGVSDAVVMLRHILPNAMVATLTFLPFILSGSVTVLATLDFLGFGLPPGSPSLGELVAQGKNNLQAPWLGITGFVVLGGDADAADLRRRGGARRLRSAQAAGRWAMSDRAPRRRRTSPSPSAASAWSKACPSTSSAARRSRWSANPARASRSPRCPACGCCRAPAATRRAASSLDGTDVLGAPEARRCGACAAASPAWSSRSR